VGCVFGSVDSNFESVFGDCLLRWTMKRTRCNLNTELPRGAFVWEQSASRYQSDTPHHVTIPQKGAGAELQLSGRSLVDSKVASKDPARGLCSSTARFEHWCRRGEERWCGASTYERDLGG
jgi:hypothetical protein